MADLRRLRPGRLVLLLIAVLAVALTFGGVLYARLTKPATNARTPAGHTSAAPPNVSPSGGSPTGSPGATATPKRTKRPNVVMILTDDMRTDDLRWMPNVRHLIEDRGLDFRNSFSPYPLCAPARASLLSGQYAHNHHVFSHVQPYGFGAFDDRRTIATSMKAAGYNTLFLGKYINGYGLQNSKVTGQPSFRYVPPGWTDWYGSVERPAGSGFYSGGTYDYYHVLFNHNGAIDDSYAGRYQSEVEGGIASQLVRKYHHSRKPFFLYFAPIAPHVGAPLESDDPTGVTWPDTGKPEEFLTPARPPWVRGIFDKQIQRASGLPQDGGPSEADVRDKPRPMRWLPELDAQERAADLNLTRQRAEALYVLDKQVKRLVNTLKATGEYRNTTIVFTSDNGYFLGEHRMRQGKIKPHEPSLRVPFVVCGPGIPHGVRYDPVTTTDLAATILDLGRAKPPHPADGVSVVPSFERDRGWRVPVLTEGLETSAVFRAAERHRAPGFDDPLTDIGIRTLRWKYVKYNDGDGELYDLVHDPNEMHSHFDDPKYAAVQARLDRLWQQRRNCAGASCRAPMPQDLQADPAQEKAITDRQSRAVDARYGYWR